MDIEYFYAAHSAFAYLGSRCLTEIAARSGCRIVHRPIQLESVIAGAGIAHWGQRSAAHMQYYFGREMERWNEYRGTSMMIGFPKYHGNDYGRANRLIIAASARDLNTNALSHGLLEAHWRDDADLADESTLLRHARAVCRDAETLLAAADSPEVRAIYEANTQEASSRSVFGSPTYFIDGDMFYGQDRLELLERTITKRFKGHWPRREGEALGRLV